MIIFGVYLLRTCKTNSKKQFSELIASRDVQPGNKVIIKVLAGEKLFDKFVHEIEDRHKSWLILEPFEETMDVQNHKARGCSTYRKSRFVHNQSKK